MSQEEAGLILVVVILLPFILGFIACVVMVKFGLIHIAGDDPWDDYYDKPDK